MHPFRFIQQGKHLWVMSCLIVVFLSCNDRKQTLFTRLPSSQSGINFVNEVHDNDSLNILDYLYFYNGGGVAVGDINNDGLQDVFFTANHKGGNKLYLNLGNFHFQDITAKAGVQGAADWNTGVTMADINGDGLLDIYVSTVSGKLHLEGHNELYINNGNGTFTERSAEYGLNFSGYSTQAAFFDYDGDGDLDCFLLNQSDHAVAVYRDTALRRTMSVAAGDKLYRNDGHRFTDVTEQAHIFSSGLGYGLGVGIGDLNNDGWDDIYVGNDFHENDYYYLNNGNGTFAERGATAFGHYSRFSMGNDVADYNNDGNLDVMTVDMLPEEDSILKTYGGEESADIYQSKIIANGFQNQYSRNCLQANIANGKRFSDVALEANVAATDWSWSPLFADFDNDGIKDLFISNGIQKRMQDLDYIKFMSSPRKQFAVSLSREFDQQVLQNIPDGKYHDYIFKGTLTGRFKDESQSWGFSLPTLSNGAAYADLDNDGDLDLVVNHVNEEAGIYRNNTSGRNYLQVSMRGTSQNRFGIGAKVYLFTRYGMQMQQLMPTRGFQSAVPPVMHFGLDTITTIDSLVVVWPGNRSQVLYHVSSNQRLVLRQQNANKIFHYDSLFHTTPQLMKDVTHESGLLWAQKQPVFYDFNRQYLIPHMLSTEGPKMAVGDVNGDGLDDIYICGTSIQAGVLFIQNREGVFRKQQTNVFATNLTEEVDALFADVNNDGYPDLYVVSGGNKYYSGDSALLDKLYLNDGHGRFVLTNKAIPRIAENKSCVRAADLNGDGLVDLFIGGRCDARTYGNLPHSYVLLNNGNGTFSDGSSQWLGRKQVLGMTTSAVLSDLNNDGKPDLVVVGDWMPVTFLSNTGKNFKDETAQWIPGKTNGWWYFVSACDMNNDGKPDLLLGNYGTNSKLQASADFPLKMYLADFDNNGTSDQLVCVNKNGRYYPFIGKEELEKQLPYLKKRYLEYRAMAGKTVEEIFGVAVLQKATQFNAYTLQSGMLLNDGRGPFQWRPFPDVAQSAPVFSMLCPVTDNNGRKELLGGGNFYGVTPYEGRYDASNLWMLQQDKNTWRSLPVASTGFFLPGEVRDIKTVRSIKGSRYIVVARNSDSVRVFQ